MRKLYSLNIAMLIVLSDYAQAPDKMSYQAVIRNSSNQLVTSHAVGMKISILQGSTTGTAVYTETIIPTPSTNANGLVSIEIGGGTGFNTIDWANGPYFIKTESDPTGGSNYTITGTSQFLSVPYALHAKTADNGFSGNYSDLSNKPNLFDGQFSSLLGAPALSLVAISGSYTDLSNKPTLFSGNFADLTNRPTTLVGYGITDAFNGTWASLTGKPALFDGQYSSLIGAPSLSLVASSGSYNDLSNKPTLFSGNFADLTNRPTTLIGYGITDAFNGTWASLTGKPALFDGQYSSLIGAPSLSLVATSGSYTDLSNKPTQFSGSFADLTNKPTTLLGYGITDAFNGTWASLSGKPILFDGQYSSLTGTPALTTVATSGSYTDLSNKPTLFSGSFTDLSNKPTTIVGYGITDAFNGTWASLSGKPILFDGQYSSLTGTPALTTVATSGSYTDLSNKPTLFSGSFTDLTNKPTTLVGYGITDAMNTSHAANGITGTNITSWNTAFGWGNHALAGYLTSYTETDPNSWSKTGNAGTTAGTNFIGTTDNKDLTFKVNNVASGRISTDGNTSFGYATLSSNTIGSENAAFGLNSMSANTSGVRNAAFGLYSLEQNTSGYQNTAFGTYSLYSNTTGFNNTVIGYGANVSSGDLSNAIAIGYGARVDASGKVQIGNSSVDYVALGTSTNVTLETGLVKITGGTPGAGKVLTSDANGLASWQAPAPDGWTLTGNSGTIDGTNFIGTTDNVPFNIRVNNEKAGRIDNTLENTFFGFQAGNISTGASNSAFGHSALSVNTSGQYNTVNGWNALRSNITGSYNTGTGAYALTSNQIGYYNVAFGCYALADNHGNNNVGIGGNAMMANNAGNNNTALGYQAGFTAVSANSNISGSNNTYIGYNSGPATTTQYNNSTTLGSNALVDASNKVQIGDNAVTAVQLGTGTNVTLETGLVKIIGGTPGIGKVLTSDATGLSSWQTVPAANGSETKLTAGTNVTVTGSGTTASPYLVNSTQAPGTQAGQMQYWNGSAWVTVASGSNGQILKYKNGVPTWSDGNINDLSIGDSYKGGIIAYFLVPGDPGYDANIKHGIIAAPSDQSTGAEWGCSGTTITGADGTALGIGNQNTIDIMAECATAGIAARLCGDLVLGVYSDWYLPSNDELNKLYLNRVAVGGFSNSTYWSSTELNSGSAYVQVFSDGTQGVIPKNDAGINVRAIRSF